MKPTSKIALWILLIATVVAAGLWLAGGKKLECSAEIEIAATPDEVFAFLVEPNKLKTWVPGLSEVKKLVPTEKSTTGPNRIVTPRTVSHNGKELRFEDEVIRYQENEFLTVQSTDANQVITSIFNLQPQGTGTRLSYRVTVVHQGLGRLLASFKTNSLHRQRQIDQDIRVLKEKVESSD